MNKTTGFQIFFFLFFAFCFQFESYSQTWEELNNLSIEKFSENDLNTALDYSLKAYNLKGIADSNLATSANNIGYIYANAQEYQKAEKYYKIALEKRQEVFGKNHTKCSETLTNMASLYRAIGDMAGSEECMQEKGKIDKKIFGNESKQYADDLRIIGVLNYEQGKYEVAEGFFFDAIEILKDATGEGSAEYAFASSNLGILYTDMGKYQDAENLFINSAYTIMQLYGERHPEFASVNNSLARVYLNLGVYDKAEKYFLKARDILLDHPDYVRDYLSCINNLGTLYSLTGEDDLTVKFKLEFKDLIKALYGESNPIYATALNNLGTAYFRMTKYQEAEPLIVDAMKIWGGTYGKSNPDYLKAAINLAYIFRVNDKIDESYKIFKETEEKWESAFGKNHPQYIIILRSLADLSYKKNDLENADKYFQQLNEKLHYQINDYFSFLSEYEKEKFIENITEHFDRFNYYTSVRYNTNPEITKYAYDNELKNRGLSLRSSNIMKNDILASNDTALIWHYNNWLLMKTELSQLYSMPNSVKNDSLINQYEIMVDIYEKELNKVSHLFSRSQQNVDWKDVQQSLKDNEAAIEFISYTNDDLERIYSALLITNKCKFPKFIELFKESKLEEEIIRKNENDFQFVNDLYNGNKFLYVMLWKPLEEQIKDLDNIYFSPTGYLHKVSFSAIKDSNGKYISDKYNLKNLSTTGLLANKKSSFSIGKDCNVKLFGGIDYNCNEEDSKGWKYLPGTREEAEQIRELLIAKNISTNYISGKSALEAEFKSCSINNPCIIHIATHGFFFPDPSVVKENEQVETGDVEFRGSPGYGVNVFVENSKPMMRSGLVFAGANDVWRNPEQLNENDGILTAYEISNILLDETKLVVMSACETGLGEIKGNEGVYGLQRAFKMAGVKYLIMSLWQVPDKETKEFMTNFYSKLISLNDVDQAFIEAQTEMRQKYDPYYWAAFVLVE